MQDSIASLESLKASDISLYAAGVPVSDDELVSEFENSDIELTVGLPGGKVHGSLARAGMYISLKYVCCQWFLVYGTVISTITACSV